MEAPSAEGALGTLAGSRGRSPRKILEVFDEFYCENAFAGRSKFLYALNSRGSEWVRFGPSTVRGELIRKMWDDLLSSLCESALYN